MRSRQDRPARGIFSRLHEERQQLEIARLTSEVARLGKLLEERAAELLGAQLLAEHVGGEANKLRLDLVRLQDLIDRERDARALREPGSPGAGVSGKK